MDGVAVDAAFNEAGTAGLGYNVYTGLGLTTHVVTFKNLTGSGCYVVAMEPQDRTNRMPIYCQGGWGGAGAADFIGGSAWSVIPQLIAEAFDYVGIYCTLNDTGAGAAFQTYYADIESLVKTAKTAGADGCLFVGFPGNDTGTLSGDLDTRARLLRSIAMDYGWSFFDFRSVLGHSYARATDLGFNYDSRHPNGDGHDAMSAALTSFLGPSL